MNNSNNSIPPTPCPICTTPGAAFDVVDFNKNCMEGSDHRLPLSGRPVYYHCCAACGFAWAPEFADWSDDDFLREIYNEAYAGVDPDYAEARPLANARLLLKTFGKHRDAIRHLDYGGGNGRLSAELVAQGWQSASFDPFPARGDRPGAGSHHNLITAFEVFEHVPQPDALMAALAKLLEDPGLLLFSTLVSDGQIVPGKRLSWWYASPRNGHISLYSRKSLKLLAKRHQLKFGSFNDNLHFCARRIPDWARHVIK